MHSARGNPRSRGRAPLPDSPPKPLGLLSPQPSLAFHTTVNRNPKALEENCKKLSFLIGLWKYLCLIELSPLALAFWCLHLIVFKWKAAMIREFRVTSASFVLKLLYHTLLELATGWFWWQQCRSLGLAVISCLLTWLGKEKYLLIPDSKRKSTNVFPPTTWLHSWCPGGLPLPSCHPRLSLSLSSFIHSILISVHILILCAGKCTRW